ncbi:MAG: glycosyltransferase family 4 protein [Sphingopyxis sp.]
MTGLHAKGVKLRILMPLSDAYGGFGGIAQYNRDVLRTLSDVPQVDQIVAVPRLISESLGDIPAKVIFDAAAAQGKLAFIVRLLRHGLFAPRADLIWCAHINLLPLCALIARLRKVPLVLMIYGLEVWQDAPGPLTRWALRQVTRLASISRFTADRFAEIAPIAGLPLDILPNAVDLSLYGMAPKSADLMARFNLSDRRIILTLARMPENATKGFDAMLEAMPRVIKAVPDALYVIGGRGEDAERLRQKADTLGIGDHVIFAGEIAEGRKADFYRLADLFAMPSSGDGFGFVFIEALACGIPVLSSTVDGGYEAIMHGGMGRGVDPGDINALAQQLIEGLDDAKHIPERLNHYALPQFAARLRKVVDAAVA